MSRLPGRAIRRRATRPRSDTTLAIATAIGRADEQAASKAALAALESRIDAKLAALRSEMRWMFGFQGALILAIAAKLFGIV